MTTTAPTALRHAVRGPRSSPVADCKLVQYTSAIWHRSGMAVYTRRVVDDLLEAAGLPEER